MNVLGAGADSARVTVGRVRPEWYRCRVSPVGAGAVGKTSSSLDDNGGEGKAAVVGFDGNCTDRRESDRFGPGGGMAEVVGTGGGGIRSFGEGERSDSGGVGNTARLPVSVSIRGVVLVDEGGVGSVMDEGEEVV